MMSSIYEDKVKNYRLIKLKFFGATNHRGFRVKLIEDFRNKVFSVTLERDYNYDSSTDQAYGWLKIKGFKVVGMARSSDEFDYFFCDNWGNDFVYLKDK